MSVEKEALERRLIAPDRRRIFQSLGFKVNGQKPNGEGRITDVLGPPELGEGERGNFSVNVETGWSEDFGSPGWKGSLYDAVMDVRGCTFPEALEWVAEQIGYRSNGHAKRAENPLSVGRLAEAKGLPPKLLHKLGVKEVQPGKLRITYRDRSGNAASVRQRLRTAASAKDGSLWEKGSEPIVPYGLWLLDRMSAKHSCCLGLEGESDPWTAWRHGFPALGIPGKAMHGTLKLEHVEDFERVYVGIEADEAGQEFARNMHERLQEIGYEGDVYALPFSEDAPDLNDLYQDDPGRFVARLERMMEEAPKLEKWLSENAPADDLNEKLQEALGFDLDYASKHPVATLRRCAKLKIEGKAEAPEEKETEAPAFVPFPVEALPAPAADYARACAKAVGCVPAMTALPLLAAMSAAVGSAARLKLKRSWREPAPLWTMLVAPSGSAKSPALKHALRPVYRREREAKKRYEQELQAYEKAKEQGENPRKPKRRRYRTGDATPESVMKLLGENPRGLLLARNELGAWLGSFDRYAQGASDLQFWIEVWDGQQASRDRVTENVTVDRPAVSVTGTIQPGALKEKLTELHFESGFAARFLLCMPPTEALQWAEADVTREVERASITFSARFTAFLWART